MDTAIDNLLLLSKDKNFLNDIMIEDDKLVEIKDDDNFDLMNTVKDYKYPILLTFEKIFFFIEYSNNFKYKNYTKDDLMSMCDDSLDMIYKIYNLNIENSDENIDEDFHLLIEFISNHYNHITENRDNIFIRLKESICYFYNNVTEAYVESKKYLYFSNNLTLIIDDTNDMIDNEIDEIDDTDNDADNDMDIDTDNDMDIDTDIDDTNEETNGGMNEEIDDSDDSDDSDDLDDLDDLNNLIEC